jgi:S-adenosylmethionine hydrolase
MDSAPMQRIVTLLSDFGTRDHYVAAVKGVLLGINPALNVVDITHQVTPQSIQQGGFLLASAFRYFPEGTIHLAIVDPGVGTERLGLAAATKRYLFVGPDNGLFDRAFALDPPQLVVALQNPDYQLPQSSATFHGRDVFAPAVGHLSLGLPLEKLGPRVTYRMRFSEDLVLTDQQELQGEIIHVDHFGNLVSNIQLPTELSLTQPRSLQVFLADAEVLIGPQTYEQAPPMQPFALRGSSGFLEVAVRNGSARELTGQDVGAVVWVRQRN